MAQFHHRRGPNVSQYIAGLNTITPELNQQDDFGTGFDSGIDLDAFTNADFFDFDLHANESDMQNGMQQFNTNNGQQSSSPTNSGEKMAFVNQPQFFPNQFSQLHQNPTLPGRTSLPSSPPNGVPLAGQIQQSQPTVPSAAYFASALSPAHQGGMQQQQQQQQQQTGSDARKNTLSSIVGGAPPEMMEEGARYAAEEDKRRRNTAASARFRVKKKQREQALEKTAREMTEKVQLLEARIGQLEMENQWLKGLITEKNVKLEGKPGGGAPGAAGNAGTNAADEEALAAKSQAQMKEDLERTAADKKRGVGTD